jgi:hypothetical protein
VAHLRKALFGGLAVLALVAFGTMPANAFQISIDSIALTGPGPTEWDQYESESSCAISANTPVDDGSYGSRTDGFDGGLLFSIEGDGYSDIEGYAQVSGNQTSTWGGDYSGLIASRVDTALQQSPTLRSLLKLSNQSKTVKTVTVMVGSDLGSDANTTLRATSTGDTINTLADRWIVTSDLSPATGDPVVTHVLYGKGAPVKPDTLNSAAGGGTECEVVSYTVKVPAGKTRYVLVFVQMHGSVKSAKGGAVPFNLLSSGSALLDGIPNKVLPQIINWNL